MAPRLLRLEAPVSKTQLGTKRVCPSCGARFYDLAHRPIACPKCKFNFEPDQIVRARKPRAEAREAQRPVDDPELEEVEGDGEEDGEDNDLLDDEEEGDASLEEVAESEAPAKASRRAKRPPPIEEEDVGVLPDEDEDDEVEAADDEDDVLAVEDEDDNDLSDILEDDDGKDEEPS